MAVDEVDTVGPRALLGDVGVDGGVHRPCLFGGPLAQVVVLRVQVLEAVVHTHVVDLGVRVHLVDLREDSVVVLEEPLFADLHLGHEVGIAAHDFDELIHGGDHLELALERADGGLEAEAEAVVHRLQERSEEAVSAAVVVAEVQDDDVRVADGLLHLGGHGCALVEADVGDEHDGVRDEVLLRVLGLLEPGFVFRVDQTTDLDGAERVAGIVVPVLDTERVGDELRVGALDKAAVAEGELVAEGVGVAGVAVHAVTGRNGVTEDDHGICIEFSLRTASPLREGRYADAADHHDHGDEDRNEFLRCLFHCLSLSDSLLSVCWGDVPLLFIKHSLL